MPAAADVHAKDPGSDRTARPRWQWPQGSAANRCRSRDTWNPGWRTRRSDHRAAPRATRSPAPCPSACVYARDSAWRPAGWGHVEQGLLPHSSAASNGASLKASVTATEPLRARIQKMRRTGRPRADGSLARVRPASASSSPKVGSCDEGSAIRRLGGLHIVVLGRVEQSVAKVPGS